MKQIKSAKYVFVGVLLGLIFQSEIATPVSAEVKDDVVAFLTPRLEHIQRSHTGLNYESIENSMKDGKRVQNWKRVRSCGSCLCIYSGIAREPKIPVADPFAWQLDASIRIPERDFYTVQLFNDRYRASFGDLSRFERDGKKTLERVDAISSPERPPALKLLLGEAFFGGSVADFVCSSTTTTVEFVDGVLNGRATKKLTVNGKVLPRDSTLYRCTWEFDAEAGYCVKSSWNPLSGGNFSGEYLVQYADTSGGKWIPRNITMRLGSDHDERTTYFRGWDTECRMDAQECFLSHHGLKEPVMSIDPKPRIPRWFVWGNVGLILLVVGWIINGRVRHRKK
jgi:hypothetical protein